MLCKSWLRQQQKVKKQKTKKRTREMKSQGKMLLTKLEKPTGKYRESELTGAATSVGTSVEVVKPELGFTNC